ncbi:MAG: hypothetical protein OXE50_16035 [Chloroflexi bacterium]|nr:hypothetical protein [Chloroflexota bacterium]
MNNTEELVLRVLRLYPEKQYDVSTICTGINQLNIAEGNPILTSLQETTKACIALSGKEMLFQAHPGDDYPYFVRLIVFYGITKKGIDYINETHPLFQVFYSSPEVPA